MQPVALIAIAILLPLGLFMYRKVRSGRWGTIDASNPRERPALFRFGLVLIVVVGAFIAFSPRLRFLSRGIVAILVLLAVAALVNRFVKASLHLAFAAYGAVILLRFAPAIGIGVLVFLPLLAWARVAMGRHTPAETAVGAAIGAAVGALALAV
jgi:membrane-associated phospholipid phosphatase